MDRKSLGKRINFARKQRQLTSEKLSDFCKVNAVHIRQIEAGIKLPSLTLFVEICNALQVSPEILLIDSLIFNALKDSPNKNNADISTQQFGQYLKFIDQFPSDES